MKIIFLGTNGWYTTSTGNTPCILIDSQNHYVIFDAGNGLYKIDKYITQNKPISLFVSHFHLDHVSGFHSLAKFNLSQGIDVYLAKGRQKDFEKMVNPPFTKGVTDLSTQIRVHELTDGQHDLDFPIQIQKLFHAYEDHGYRVTLEGKIVVYSGDTGRCDQTKLLAKNADVLIHECSYLKAPTEDTWGHVDATQAAKLAKQAAVKQLILTHFDPTQYTTLDDRKKAEKIAQTIFPNTACATDDLVITL